MYVACVITHRALAEFGWSPVSRLVPTTVVAETSGTKGASTQTQPVQGYQYCVGTQFVLLNARSLRSTNSAYIKLVQLHYVVDEIWVVVLDISFLFRNL